MLFCCALAPSVDAKTMEALGGGALSPCPVRLNVRVSIVSTPCAAAPDFGVNDT